MQFNLSINSLSVKASEFSWRISVNKERHEDQRNTADMEKKRQRVGEGGGGYIML